MKLLRLLDAARHRRQRSLMKHESASSHAAGQRRHVDDAALDKLDRAILLPVYPAREEPIEGVNTGMIYDRMKLKNKILAEKDDLPALLQDEKAGIVLTLGAGDIDKLVEPIENILLKKLG